MDQSQSINLINVLLLTGVFISGGIFASMLMVLGYWAGRNSRELPFITANSPRKAKPQPEIKTATGEPEDGDIFNDAAYGEDRAPVSTITQGAR